MLGAPSHGHSETEMQPDVEGTRPYVRCMHRCRCHCSGCGRVQLPSVRCRGAFACCGFEVVACGAVACRSLLHRNLELCKTLKTTTEQFSLFSTEQFGGRRIKSGTRGKPPRRVRVTATRAWAQLAGVCASKMLPYIIFFMPLVRSQPVSRAAASLGPKGPAVLRRRCRQYGHAPRDSWQHVS